jgi:hypothetical protein
MRYIPGDCFETFPIPKESNELAGLGERYWNTRSSLSTRMGVGLYDIYKRLHNPDDSWPEIEQLRKLHQEIDYLCLREYGFDINDLGHGFHNIAQSGSEKMRFTISESSRLDVLRCLRLLNRQRHDEEIAQGLHGGAIKKSAQPRILRNKTIQQDGLNFSVEPATRTSEAPLGATSAILDYLYTHSGWHAKRDILAATGLPDGQWNAAINDLIDRGDIERQGEKRGARYRAMTRSQAV